MCIFDKAHFGWYSDFRPPSFFPPFQHFWIRHCMQLNCIFVPSFFVSSSCQRRRWLRWCLSVDWWDCCNCWRCPPTCDGWTANCRQLIAHHQFITHARTSLRLFVFIIKLEYAEHNNDDDKDEIIKVRVFLNNSNKSVVKTAWNTKTLPRPTAPNHLLA